MKAVSLLIESGLPKDLRNPDRNYDKKSVDELLADVARKYPEKYPEIVQHIADVGRNASYLQGETLKLSDMKAPFDKEAVLRQMDQELAQVSSTTKDPEKLKVAKFKIWNHYAQKFEKLTIDSAMATGNNLANTVVSGARGNPSQLKAMVATPGIYTDYKGRAIPLFVRRSFGEGLRPYEHMASAYGTRAAVLSTKGATARFGDIGKQLMAVGAGQSVSQEDCGTTNGISVSIDDPDIVGRVLPHAVGPIEAGTTVDKTVVNALRKQGIKNIIARSPLTCQAKDGICSRCLGLLAEGKFAPIGYQAGITAASGSSEPLTQLSLNCLAEGTVVRMADTSVKAIESIVPGDKVMGANRHGETFPVVVTHVWDQGMQPCRNYTYRDFANSCHIDLECTEAHIALFSHSTRYDTHPIGDLCSALLLMVIAKSLLGAQRTGNEAIGEKPCWDITVDHPDHLFVLANGMIVSNSKHTGGISTGGKKEFSGYEAINQLLQSPETFPNKATVASLPGTVDSIEEAPQGGKYVKIAGVPHYALPGFEINVKPGDQVEAGDQLSDGIVDTADVLKHRGLGEARKYYVDRLAQAFVESGAGRPSKVNLEVLARGTLDHVKIDDPDGMGDYLTDDLGSYNRLASDYSPPSDTKNLELDKTHGQYLQTPALHFTIGTQLTPKMTHQLKEAGYTTLPVSAQTPRFTPEMVRLRSAMHNGTDWFSKLQSSYLTSNIQKDAERARDTNFEENSHYAPRLAIGKDFGKKIETTGKF